MAYVSKEKIKQVREDLKREFPEIKFRVNKGQHYSTVYVVIVRSPYNFIPNGEYHEVNHYWIDNGYAVKPYEQDEYGRYKCVPYGRVDILKRIVDIMNVGNHDNSDIMTDYHDVGFYINLRIGDYNKPYECTGVVGQVERPIIEETPEQVEVVEEPQSYPHIDANGKLVGFSFQQDVTY